MDPTWKEPEILIVVVKLELFDKPFGQRDRILTSAFGKMAS